MFPRNEWWSHIRSAPFNLPLDICVPPPKSEQHQLKGATCGMRDEPRGAVLLARAAALFVSRRAERRRVAGERGLKRQRLLGQQAGGPAAAPAAQGRGTVGERRVSASLSRQRRSERRMRHDWRALPTAQARARLRRSVAVGVNRNKK